MSDETKLLKRIGAIPVGEKLPLSRFAREFNCSVSVIWTMVERLVEAGKLDRDTMRPAEADCEDSHAWLFEGAIAASVGKALKAIAAGRGLGITAASKQIFGNKTQLSWLSGSPTHVGKVTVDRIRKWLESPVTEKRAAVPVARDADAGVVCSERSTPADLDGEALHAEIVAAAGRIGITLNRLATAIWPISPGWKLEQLRIAKRPRAGTVERIRAAILAAEAGEELPGPARRNPTQAEAVAVTAERRVEEDVQREASERAQDTRRPGETLAEAVKRECDDLANRRLRARVGGGGIRPVDLDEDDDADLGSITAARRQREAQELSTPSSLIRRANEEWPERSAKVASIAVQLGVKLGEAWERVIGAGILAVEEDLREEQDDERRAA